MAKLLGQDIVTQEEFDAFVAADFKRHETEMIMLRTEMVALKKLNSAVKYLAFGVGASAAGVIALTLFVALH